MVEAFQLLGHEITLVVPANQNGVEKEVKDIFAYYGVESFKIVYFPWAKFPGSKYLYSLAMAIWLSFKRKDLVYARDFYPALAAVLFGHRTVFEFHVLPKQVKGLKRYFNKLFFNSKKHIASIAITYALKKALHSKGLDPDKIFVAPDSAASPPNIASISLSKDKFHIGYLGHLYEGKGMKIISRLCLLLPAFDFHLVGGRESDIHFWKMKLGNTPNLIFHGFVPYSQVSKYIQAFDVCLLPNQPQVRVWGHADTDIGSFTSPLKMFDYLAHGKPIVASDLPVLREVLNEKNAILCPHDQPEIWANALVKLQSEPLFRQELGLQAKKSFEHSYTWEIRANNIINFIDR